MGEKFRLVVLASISASLMILLGCQASNPGKPETYLANYHDYMPSVERFQVCHNVDCDSLTAVKLDKPRWKKIASIFALPAKSAVAEREQIKSAIASFEQVVGPIAMTQNDQARNDMGDWTDRQLDCIAEAVNSTTYLLLMQQKGWLRWHKVAYPRHRGPFSLQAPHNTAVIAEKISGRQYVVDSWFHKNGVPPEIVPVQQWSAGFDPAH